MKVTKKEIIFSSVFIIFLLILFLLKNTLDPINIQINKLKNGSLTEKTTATEFVKNYKIITAIPLLIGNISDKDLSCNSVRALTSLTGATVSNLDVCEDRIAKSDDLLKMVQNEWVDWHYSQEYKGWQIYRDEELGFELKYPEKYYAWHGSCEYSDGRYQVINGFVPTKVFALDKIVYINQAFKYIDGQENGCQQIDNSLGLLKEENNWKIVIKDNIKNDEDLNGFIQEYYIGYGGGCRLGEKKASQQEGVYDITMYYDGKDLGESSCFINAGTVMKYYPEKHKVVAWITGQEPYFWTDDKYINSFDRAMIDSFKFIDSPR